MRFESSDSSGTSKSPVPKAGFPPGISIEIAKIANLVKEGKLSAEDGMTLIESLTTASPVDPKASSEPIVSARTGLSTPSGIAFDLRPDPASFVQDATAREQASLDTGSLWESTKAQRTSVEVPNFGIADPKPRRRWPNAVIAIAAVCGLTFIILVAALLAPVLNGKRYGSPAEYFSNRGQELSALGYAGIGNTFVDGRAAEYIVWSLPDGSKRRDLVTFDGNEIRLVRSEIFQPDFEQLRWQRQ